MKMNILFVLTFSSLIVHYIVLGAVIDDGEVVEQGLYNKSDHVIILTPNNFEKNIMNQKESLVVQFYSSDCGHCRRFAPEYKALAASVTSWKPIMKLCVYDCTTEGNFDICREYEVMSYPSVRYFHENYFPSNIDHGTQMPSTDSGDKLKSIIIAKLQAEQSNGRLQHAPSLSLFSYSTYSEAIHDVPSNTKYTFLVFENVNSTVGSEIIMDINDYKNIVVKRVSNDCELAAVAGIKVFPGLLVLNKSAAHTVLTPKHPTKPKLLRAINAYLKNNPYEFPPREIPVKETETEVGENTVAPIMDIAYYSDLERTIKQSFHTEITRYKEFDGEKLQSLINFLNALINTFPFKSNNLRDYVTNLKNIVSSRNEWEGSELYKVILALEKAHAPVFSEASEKEFIGCKGSQPIYRGFPCGMWTLFHTMTVNAALRPGTEGPRALQAIHGYMKYFFACSQCSEHFQEMAKKNKLFQVGQNDKALLWLWVGHNEVNLRLAGDVTEDPKYPKLQFPSAERCPECRLHSGAWNLPAVYEYLINVYGASKIQDTRHARSAASPTSPFTNVDIGMLSLLYILSFIILIVVIKFFLTKRFLRKRVYKHGLGLSSLNYNHCAPW